MNKKTIITLTLALVCSTSISFAQKFKIIEGKKDALKGSTQINTVFDYSNLSVGKYDNEADYIEKKKTDYNNKESGRGNRWEKSWNSDREKRYEPQFIELFNKNGEGMKAGKFSDAPYTMTIHTTAIEPGYNIGISRANAETDGEIIITETGNPEKIILKISFKGAKGRTFGGGDFDTGLRISECYALLGKSLAKYLN